MDYLLIAEKFAVGMFVIIFQINMLGKYEFSINTPLNQIQNYVLGGIIGGVIFNMSISLLRFFIILLIWSLVVVVVKLASDSSRRVHAVLEGTPQMLVRNGQVDVAECVQVGLSADQLARRLREEGIESVSDVSAALMETNGKLTVMRKGEQGPWLPVIADGHIDDDALELEGRDRTWLFDQLASQGIERESDVFLGEVVDDELRVVSYPRVKQPGLLERFRKPGEQPR